MGRLRVALLAVAVLLAVLPPGYGAPPARMAARIGMGALAPETRSAAARAANRADFPWLEGDTIEGSLSVGDTSHGRLIQGAELHETDTLGILPTQRARAMRYGTDALVAALEHTASELYRVTGTRLWVGHLSRRGGGDIPFSVSHNSGRDADIAFAYRNAKGEPAYPDELVPVAPDGSAIRGGYWLDTARTWQIVKALITFAETQVQYLFVSGSIEGKLLRHATLTGEEAPLIARAGALMQQPGRAAPHNDHLHLRIYCARRDVLGGCRNTGMVHPFAQLFVEDAAAFADQVADRLTASDAETRRRAIERLALLGADAHAGAIVDRLHDDAFDVRLAAALALLSLDHEGAAQALRGVLDNAEQAARAAAIERIARGAELRAVPALIPLLRDESGREPALAALRRITNASYGASAVDRRLWRDAWASAGKRTRGTWLISGFRAAGYRVLRLHPDYVWELVRALDGPDHIARNAANVLGGLFSRERAEPDCHGWHAWLTTQRDVYGLPHAPRALCR